MSILSAQRLREFPGFIEKVGEIRQLNKFNNLLNKKEGYITRVNSSPKPSFSGRQVLTFPPGEESSLEASQAGSQASQAFQAVTSQAGTHLPPQEGSNLVATQATQADNPPGSCSPYPWGRKQFSSFSSHSGRQGWQLPFPLRKKAV